MVTATMARQLAPRRQVTLPIGNEFFSGVGRARDEPEFDQKFFDSQNGTKLRVSGKSGIYHSGAE